MKAILRGHNLQRARLVAGLLLMAFAATHFLNHAMGLISVTAMHDFAWWRNLVTRSLVGSVILGAALVVHIVLALAKLANRTTWRMPIWEWAQIITGLLIPFWLFPHIVNTRVASTFFNVDDNYLYELARLWPANAAWQSLLLLLVWVHGCLGIHYWARLDPLYRSITPVLLFVAIALPVAALGGFMISGRAVAALVADPSSFAGIKEVTRWPNAASEALLAQYRTWARWGFAVALVAAVGYALVRYLRLASAKKFVVHYSGGPAVETPTGPTLLEISRRYRIPHASVCGGRARCSTCRVRIEEGFDRLNPPSFPEAVTLGSIDAPHNVRLACQIRPVHDLTVTRLLRPASTGPQHADYSEADSDGVERELAVMFLDIRDFSNLSENKLPYDVVYILNEFFRATGSAIATNGGWIDKFLGDGLLAIFGQRDSIDVACRQALRAARAIDLALDHVNARLEAEVGKPLRIGIGLHAGRMLLGRIGHGESISLTVIGDAVNVASRLESVAKERQVQLVVSRTVADHAGWNLTGANTEHVEIRGLSSALEIVKLLRGRDLPPKLLAPGSGETEGGRARRRMARAPGDEAKPEV
jgi:adenylate cyclase